MKSRVSYLLGTMVLSTVGAVHAQQSSTPAVPQSLSLNTAIELASRYSPVYRQSANDYSAAAWGVRNAYAAFVPTFNVSTTFNYRGAGSQRFLTTNFEQPSATIGSSYSLSLNWTLDGNTLMQPGVQKEALHATAASIDAAHMTLRNQVVQQYLAALEAQAQVQLQQQQVARNEENLRLAQARFDVGQTTMLDVRQAEVAKGQSDVALLRGEQLVTVEKLRLFQQLGVPAPDDLSLTVLSDTFAIVEPTFSLQDLLALADVDNPDLHSLRAQASSAARSEHATKSQWLPSLFFSAGWSGFTDNFTNGDFLVQQAEQGAADNLSSCQDNNVIRTSAGLGVNDCSGFTFTPAIADQIRASNSTFPFNFAQQPFRASVTVQLPIFDQFSRNLQISQASAQTDDAREQLRARELQVRTDVSQLYYGVLAAYTAIGIEERNLESAQEQMRLARERYRVGSGTFFELLDAQLVDEQAKADHITAVYTYHRAQADLEAAVGGVLRTPAQ